MFKSVCSMCKVIPSLLRPIQNNFSALCMKAVGASPSMTVVPHFSLSTTTPRYELMEFFEDKKNWGEQQIKVGRSWRLEELRLRSNVDLHKLWYVLLKELNMLLTMEHECKEEFKLFPNPERIDKVKESMKNLEGVVRERNRAYHLLETGETGEREGQYVRDELGRLVYRKSREHLLPRYMRRSKYNPLTTAMKSFIILSNEQKRKEFQREHKRNVNHVLGLLRRFPNIDKDELKRRYPRINVENLLLKRKADGHFIRQ